MSAPSAPSPAKAPADRFVAIDVLRGFVMVLMTIDHASETFNRGRVFTDAVVFWTPGSPLPVAQFLTRWMTHLCAPTFVLLAGTSLSIAVESRRTKGSSEASIDRYILTRGALIVGFELLWMSWAMLGPGRLLFQVLYAIGASLMAMALLRRLSDAALGAVGLGIVVLGEVFANAVQAAGLGHFVPASLLFLPGFYGDGRVIIAYPMLPWLGIMMLGWVLGRTLMAWRTAGTLHRVPRVLALAGAFALAVFAVLRGIDGYGNMHLHRDSGALVQWLHVSKYPPSITFTTLELGITALLLAGLFAVTRRVQEGKGGLAGRLLTGGPLRLFGQVALFYYLLHVHVLHLAAFALDLHDKLGVVSAYVGALAVLVVLYPACVFYRRYKAAQRGNARSFTHYV